MELQGSIGPSDFLQAHGVQSSTPSLTVGVSGVWVILELWDGQSSTPSLTVGVRRGTWAGIIGGPVWGL